MRKRVTVPTRPVVAAGNFLVYFESLFVVVQWERLGAFTANFVRVLTQMPTATFVAKGPVSPHHTCGESTL